MQQIRGRLSSDAVDFTQSNPEQLYDAIAMCGEEAMEQFLENGTVGDDLIRSMIAGRELFPCYFGSALKLEGIDVFLDALDRMTVSAEYPEQFGARVYKIMRDADGARVTMMKITGGQLRARAELMDGEETAKIHQIRFYNGSKYTTGDIAQAGEICGVTGLKYSFAGQGFGLEEEDLQPLVNPVLRYRVIFPNGEDPVRMLGQFRLLEEENPELLVSWEEDDQAIYVSVMGEVQLQILTELFLERTGVKVSFDDGEIMYRETIAGPVIGAGHFEPLRHYAEVQLLLEPLDRGSGIELANLADSDRLSVNWQRLILTNLAEKQHKGVLTGSPITDIRITLLTGKAHLKHTEGGDFRQAVYRAVRQGLMMAESILLEPYGRFVLTIPSDSVGRAMNDLDRAGAEFSAPGIAPEHPMAVITGRGPISSLKEYSGDVMAYTKGRGSFQLISDGYDTCRNPQEVILSRGYDPLADLANTPDSVFCTHGSGYIVSFAEVYRHLHTPLGGSAAGWLSQDLKAIRSEGSIDPDKKAHSYEEPNRSIGTEEINEIISRISGANRKEQKKKQGWDRRSLSRYRTERDLQNAVSKKRSPAASAASMFSLEQAEIILVDGYNVIFAWQELSDLARINIDAARDALIDCLSELDSMVDGRVEVVFDAYRVKGHSRESMMLQNIRVQYTSQDETADHYIERYTNENARKSRIAVITSDGMEQIITRGQGCLLVTSRELKSHLERLRNGMHEQYDVKS